MDCDTHGVSFASAKPLFRIRTFRASVSAAISPAWVSAESLFLFPLLYQVGLGLRQFSLAPNDAAGGGPHEPQDDDAWHF